MAKLCQANTDMTRPVVLPRFAVSPKCRLSLKCIASGKEQPKPNYELKTNRRRVVSLAPAACACSWCVINAAKAATGRNSFMDSIFAQAMATGMDDYEAAITPTKTKLFAELNQYLKHESKLSEEAALPAHVVEIGCGTGPNLRYYSHESTRITAVDPNSYMLPFLKENMKKLGWNHARVSWKEGVAEELPIDDCSADAVVCTLVLCSVRDVDAVTRQVRRVLRPGGKFLFIEHTLAPRDRLLLRVGQLMCDPLQRMLADGCSLLRDPMPAIERAGLDSSATMRFSVEGMGLIGPHVAGIATKN